MLQHQRHLKEELELSQEREEGRDGMSRGSEVAWHLGCAENSSSLTLQEESALSEQSQESRGLV